MNDRYFKVIKNGNFGFSDFTGQTLKFVRYYDGDGILNIPGYIMLEQPSTDINGKSCNGVVSFDISSLEEVT